VSGGGAGGHGPQGVLAGALWAYAGTVLYPSQVLKHAGLLRLRAPVGEPPVPPADPADAGLGPRFSRQHAMPVLLDSTPQGAALVEDFDRMAEVYDAYVSPFSTPIFDEALREMRPYLTPRARVLDAGCGSGRELQRVARVVTDGEVVGIDLAAGMVNAAFRDARAHGLTNVALVQADVATLPSSFVGAFDVVYSSLAHHHYPDPKAATAAIRAALRPGGVYFVVDPGPAWYGRIRELLARWSDPGWMSFQSPEQFVAMFRAAGFARASWRELLPGFGIAMAQAPSAADRG
jgi:ubiquinone/menaquinone biosynthesis C-methylase UbiE